MLRLAGSLIGTILLAAVSQAATWNTTHAAAGVQRFEGPAPVPDPISFPPIAGINQFEGPAPVPDPISFPPLQVRG
jgi:hypothetical protein